MDRLQTIKDQIVKLIGDEPGLDATDIARRLNLGLREAVEITDEMMKEGLIEPVEDPFGEQSN